MAQNHELAAHATNRLAVVFAQISEGLEIGHQPPGQPHHLDSALRLLLKTPAGLNAIEVTVDVELQKHCGVIRRPARCRRSNPFKTELAHIQFIHEHIDHSNRIGFIYVIVQRLG